MRSLLSLLILLCTAPAMGDTTTVSLRTGARVSQGEPITLRMVADLSGPLAETLGNLVVEPGTNRRGPATVSIDLVRDLVLASAEQSAVLVKGTTCELRVTSPVSDTRITNSQATQATAKPGTTTLQDQIIAHLTAMFGVDEDSIRLTFESRDHGLLATAINGRVAEIRASGFGRRVPLNVAIYEGERVVAEGSVRVTVSLRRSLAVLSGDLPRGATVSAEHLISQERWIDADDTSYTTEQSIGQMTKRRLRAGDTLRADVLEAPILIYRGDVVTVRSVRGSAVVRLRARATQDGRLGEQIDLEHTTQQDGRARRSRMTARVIGPGQALIGVAAPQGTME